MELQLLTGITLVRIALNNENASPFPAPAPADPQSSNSSFVNTSRIPLNPLVPNNTIASDSLATPPSSSSLTTPTSSKTTITSPVTSLPPSVADYSSDCAEESILFKYIGQYPYEAPKGFQWVPNGWKLVAATPKTFEEIFLDKVKIPLGKNKNDNKRRRLDCRSKIISLQDFWKIRAREGTKEEKKKRATTKKKTAPKRYYMR